MQCGSYEKRIRELEQRLAEQHQQLQKFVSTDGHMHSRSHGQGEVGQGQGAERREQEAESSGTSGVTGDGIGRVGVPEPMDEGVTSNVQQASSTNSIEGRTDSCGGQRGGTREGGDETMSDVSGLKFGLSLHVQLLFLFFEHTSS